MDFKDIEKQLRAKIDEACKLLAATMRSHLPDGELQDSINYVIDGLEGRVGTDLEYAKYVEYGTRKRAPNSFIRRSVDEDAYDIGKRLGG